MTPLLVRYLKRIRGQTASKNIKTLCTQVSPEEEYYSTEKIPHVPVMLNEVIENLNLKEGNMFLDMTFGAGGHSSALLEKIPNLKVFALDRDPLAMEYISQLKEKYKNQVTPLLGKFSDLNKLLTEIGVKQNSFDGVLFDLGVSSMQLDIAERGFSVLKDGPLDMRMDGERIPKQLSAADVVNYASENELYHIFKTYGNESKSAKLAKEIVVARQNFTPLKTTRELAELIETVCGDQVRLDKLVRRTHNATKIFQALRIFVNNELSELNYGLAIVHKYLKPGKRAVVISFHSLEDLIVKRHFNNQVLDRSTKPLPLRLVSNLKYFDADEMLEFEEKHWDPVFKKVIVPTEEEVENNPRSRSAKLRVAVKLNNKEE